MLAIALRVSKLSDTSLIITWLTETEGKLRTAARGARRLKSPLAGQTGWLCLSDIVVVRSRRTDLHTLREAVLVDAHAPLRTNYLNLRLAAYFGLLLDQIVQPEHPAPELFDLLRKALAHLCKTPPSRRVLERFELRLATALGIHDGGDPAVSLSRILHHLPAERFKLLAELE